MPIHPSFDNKVRLVTGSPVGASQINAELSTQNGLGYWATQFEFIDGNNLVIVFGKFEVLTGQLQKVNLVAGNQAAVDADKAAETPGGYWPTGTLTTPTGGLLIIYQLLGTGT